MDKIDKKIIEQISIKDVLVQIIHKVNMLIDNKKDKKEYCQCYKDGNKPPLLTDWRKTNICQMCLKPLEPDNINKK